MSPRIDFGICVIRKLKEMDDITSFRCSEASLNEFIKEEALAYQRELMGNTYVVLQGGALIAFFTLSMDNIRVQKIPSDLKIDGFWDMEYYPAMKIGRLAVDERYERMGGGTYLLRVIFDLAMETTQAVACRFITVNAKRNAIPFYERNGFITLKSQEKRREPTMCLDIVNGENPNDPLWTTAPLQRHPSGASEPE